MKQNILKLENQICFPMYAVSKEIIRNYKPLLKPLGITYTQYLTMLVLWEHKEMSIKDIGDFLYLDSGTLTPLLKRMENEKLIERFRNNRDERIVLVRLTKKGMDLKKKALNIPDEVKKSLNIKSEEIDLLYNILYKILGNICRE